MRLLHTTTCELQEFPYDKLPEYAILSHRWENVEVTFADLQERKRLVAHGEWLLSTTNKEKAWAKVYNACKFARENDFDWLWLDMCCIDKTSSAELQEAINSMFAWYRDATLCVAYLNDVPNLATEDPKLEGSQLRKSVWFTRGWTLQELIAPNASIEFLSKDWTYLGCRDGLAEVIAEITNVDVSLLSVQTDDSQERLDFSRWSVATRMSWAANRTTSRPEDQAYSLAGFFDVSMSISYGEGGEQAFWRLQLEIIRRSPDQSIFAWKTQITLSHVPHSSMCGPLSSQGGPNFQDYVIPRNLLASQPSDFTGCSDLRAAPIQHLMEVLGLLPPTEPHFHHTNYGIRIQLPLLRTRARDIFLAALACRDGSLTYWQVLVLRQIEGGQTYMRVQLQEYLQPEPITIDHQVPEDGDAPPPWKATTIYIQWQCEPRTGPLSFMDGLVYYDTAYTRAEVYCTNHRDNRVNWEELQDTSESLSRCSVSEVLDAAVIGLRPTLSHVRSAFERTKQLVHMVKDPMCRDKVIRIQWVQTSVVEALLRERTPAGLADIDAIPDHTISHGPKDTCRFIEDLVVRLGNIIWTYIEGSRLGHILREEEWTKTLEGCAQDIGRLYLELTELHKKDPQGRYPPSYVLSPDKIRQILFPTLQRTGEKACIREKLQSLGGVEACLWDDILLNALARFISEVETSDIDISSPLSAAELRCIRTPVDQLVERNLRKFVLDLYHPVDHQLHSNSIKTVPADQCPSEMIKDRDIQKLWKSQGWGAEVNIRTFFLGLYRYFVDLEHESRVPGNKKSNNLDSAAIFSPPPIDADTQCCDVPGESTTPEAAAQDVWCLNYFHSDTFKILMEAIDIDVRDTISTLDVNRFTHMRPEGITFLQWIAYKAYGSLVSTHIYRLRIERIIESITKLDYARDNVDTVADYMDDCLPRVMVLLQHLRGLDPEIRLEERLLELTHRIMMIQEQDVNEILEQMNYEYEDEDDDVFIAMMNPANEAFPRENEDYGIEHRMLPALFLIMQYHYAILSLTQQYVMDENTLSQASPIKCIWELAQQRVAELCRKFWSSGTHIDTVIAIFAHGMYKGIRRYRQVNEDKLLRQEPAIRRQNHLEKPRQWIQQELEKYDHRFQSDTSLDAAMLPSATSEGDCMYLDDGGLSVDGGPSLLSAFPSRVVEYVKNHCLLPRPSVVYADCEDIITPSHDDCICSGEHCEDRENLRGERYKCADCPDINYCSQCFMTNQSKHENGAHRFLLLRYRTAEVMIQHLLAAILEADAADSVQVDAWSDTTVSNPPIHGSYATRDDKYCEGLLCVEEQRTYRCISCRFNHHRELVLCRKCAFSDTARGPHWPTHVFAVISDKIEREVYESDVAHADNTEPLENAQETIESLSQKVKTMESKLTQMAQMEERMMQMQAILNGLQGSVG